MWPKRSTRVRSTSPIRPARLSCCKANAVVGVTGFFSEDGKTLTSVGIQCAVCHSTVDDAYAPGIGQRLDGWPNRDLNIGAIVALAPDLTAFTEMLQISEAEVKKAVEAGVPANSTPSSTSTARRSVRTARRPPRSIRRHSDWPA